MSNLTKLYIRKYTWCLSIYFRIIYTQKTIFLTWGHSVFCCVWRCFVLKAHRVWFAHNTLYLYFFDKMTWYHAMNHDGIFVFIVYSKTLNMIHSIKNTHIQIIYYYWFNSNKTHVSILSKILKISKIKIISNNTTLNNIINVCDWCQKGV